MYCENCGHKLNSSDLFCGECGSQIKRIIQDKPKNSNKTLWIVLGFIFGSIFLVFVLFIILLFRIVNYSIIEEEYNDYEVNDYIEEYDNISSIDSF